MASLTEEQWDKIDPYIFKSHVIFAIKLIREQLAVGIHEAIDIVDARYEKLRQERNSEFLCSREEWGRGFYS